MFAVGLVAGLLVQRLAIKPTLITDDDMTLDRPDARFVDALGGRRGRGAAEYQARRAAKRAGRRPAR